MNPYPTEETRAAREARLEENRRRQAAIISRRLQEDKNRRVAELLMAVSQRKEQR